MLRPEALAYLSNCDHILHAGDVGNDQILATLGGIAPLTAIRGNVDRTGACSTLAYTQALEIAGHLFYLIHARADLDLHPKAASIAAIISGHTHRPEISWCDGILYFNPGSAGPKRFQLPVTLGIIEATAEGLVPHIETVSV